MSEFKDAIKSHSDGAILNLFVKTKSKDVVFPAGYNTWRKCLEIKVCSEAKENRANKDVIKAVAKYFNKPVTNVFIVSGEKSREKTLLVKGVSVDDVSRRLRESLDGL
ncbi:MAG: DUF167 domain-containing protein [Candidatus Thermoplasmatota archaeon]|jgi:uncharacterized protein (TIGR00251 family)|nr:DUF167 domain-containing protein [Candidatus Thermoplasmatota archaeon]